MSTNQPDPNAPWQQGAPPPPPQSGQSYPPAPHGGQHYPSAPQPGPSYPSAPQPGQPYPAGTHTGWGNDPAPGQRPDAEDRTMMILAHLSAPAAFLLSAGTLSFLGPLVIWLFYKDRSHAVRHASAGAFNFNLAFWVVNILALVLAFLTLGLGLVLAVPVWIITFVVAAFAHIKGALRAAGGDSYTYPFQIPVLR